MNTTHYCCAKLDHFEFFHFQFSIEFFLIYKLLKYFSMDSNVQIVIFSTRKNQISNSIIKNYKNYSTKYQYKIN